MQSASNGAKELKQKGVRWEISRARFSFSLLFSLLSSGYSGAACLPAVEVVTPTNRPLSPCCFGEECLPLDFNLNFVEMEVMVCRSRWQRGMGAVLPEQPLSLHFLPTLCLLAPELPSACCWAWRLSGGASGSSDQREQFLLMMRKGCGSFKEKQYHIFLFLVCLFSSWGFVHEALCGSQW